MKVFALGGCGKVGLPAIKLLAASDLVTEIAVAGRNLERAERPPARSVPRALPSAWMAPTNKSWSRCCPGTTSF